MLLAPGEETLGDRTLTLLLLDELTCDEGGTQARSDAITLLLLDELTCDEGGTQARSDAITSSLLVPSESFGARVTSSSSEPTPPRMCFTGTCSRSSRGAIGPDEGRHQTSSEERWRIG